VATSIRTFLPVVGDPETLARLFAGDPTTWLKPTHREGPDLYAVTLRGGGIRRPALASVGSPWRSATTTWRTLTWDPVADDGSPTTVDRLLPSLDGELGLHIDGERVTLILDARYRPPGGPLGAAVDLVALRRVARNTIERFLEDVVAQLGAAAVLAEGVGAAR
jgi:hypothetical protein